MRCVTYGEDVGVEVAMWVLVVSTLRVGVYSLGGYSVGGYSVGVYSAAATDL